MRGFILRQAATPWAPPTAEQIGLIGTNWSKGWIIEDNTISHSICSGVSLGKHGDEFDNTSADTAEGYVQTIDRAFKRGWSRENIGQHLVRRNRISHCEQAGVVGSMGAVFSTVSGNIIHDIHVRQLFTGAEMAGIKLHGAIDVEISGNHIYRSCRGLWLDWMAQGARVTGNVFHDNQTEDLFVEVNHGPFLVDNNIFLSRRSLLSLSQGGAYVHNLVAGNLVSNPFDGRMTPFHRPHSTELAGMHDNPFGDDRWCNNVFVGPADLSFYDNATLPVQMAGNVFLKGAKSSKWEPSHVSRPGMDPGLELVEKGRGVALRWRLESDWKGDAKRTLVTTDSLGKTAISQAYYENPDGSGLRIDRDYWGHARGEDPCPGPFERWGGKLKGSMVLPSRDGASR